MIDLDIVVFDLATAEELAEQLGGDRDEELYEEALSMLVSSVARAGGALGIGDRKTEPETRAFLREVGIITPRGFLTRKGGDLAFRLQRVYFRGW